MYCRRYLSTTENRISAYNERFSESNELSTVNLLKCSLNIFLLVSLFASFISFSIKARIVLQSSVHHLFPIFISALTTSTQGKISLPTSLFTETCLSSYFYFHNARVLPISLCYKKIVKIMKVWT